MKIEVGLIGDGKWASKIKPNLIKVSNLKFICDSKKSYLIKLKENKIKWVFIATPNKTHYPIVRDCLNKRINVFCEKPLCLTLNKAKKLIQIAKEKKVKLYVSDIYDYYSKKFDKLTLSNNIYRSKFVKGSDVEFFNRFMYHDISILYYFLKKNKVKYCAYIPNQTKKLFKIVIKFVNNKKINFLYNLNSNKKMHFINNTNIFSKKNYLQKMIVNVLYDKVDIKENNEKALFIIDYLAKIRKKIKYDN